ncbi:MAG: alpha/beta hydrolase [Clostridiales bacterium]|nr:alpha/beta hydrolase [Clostridiales bacterium]
MNKKVRNGAIIGAAAIGAAAGVNKLISAMADTNDDLPKGSGRFYDWRYGKIYYTKTGKGTPLLLIHDLDVASSAYEWSKVFGKLSRRHTVYTIDLLGCGRSDKPNLTYTNYMYVQLINNFIRKVIGVKTDVAATGDSFSFAVMACNMEPENFGKLIGISPCDLFKLTRTPDKKNNAMKYVIDSPIIGTSLYNMDTAKPNISLKASHRYFHKENPVPDSMKKAYYKASKTGDGGGKYLLASIKSHYTNINIIPALQKINNSICLIGGRQNPLINDIFDEYREYNPSIEEAYISEANYLPQLEAPDKFVELLQILLD